MTQLVVSGLVRGFCSCGFVTIYPLPNMQISKQWSSLEITLHTRSSRGVHESDRWRRCYLVGLTTVIDMERLEDREFNAISDHPAWRAMIVWYQLWGQPT